MLLTFAPTRSNPPATYIAAFLRRFIKSILPPLVVQAVLPFPLLFAKKPLALTLSATVALVVVILLLSISVLELTRLVSPSSDSILILPLPMYVFLGLESCSIIRIPSVKSISRVPVNLPPERGK